MITTSMRRASGISDAESVRVPSPCVAPLTTIPTTDGTTTMYGVSKTMPSALTSTTVPNSRCSVSGTANGDANGDTSSVAKACRAVPAARQHKTMTTICRPIPLKIFLH